MTIDALQHHTKNHVYFSATNAAKHVYAYHQARMGTKRNVHAMTIGRQRKASLSAHDIKIKPSIYAFM